MFSLTKRQALILPGVVLLLVLGGYMLYQHNANQEAKLQQATLLNEQQARDKNVLENELRLSKQNAELMAQFVAKAQANQV